MKTLIAKAMTHDERASDPGCAVLELDADTAAELRDAIIDAQAIFEKFPDLQALEFESPLPVLMDFGDEDEDDKFHRRGENYAVIGGEEYPSLRNSTIRVDLKTLNISRNLDLHWSRRSDVGLLVTTNRINAQQLLAALEEAANG